MLKITLFKLKHFTNTLYDYNETFLKKIKSSIFTYHLVKLIKLGKTRSGN